MATQGQAFTCSRCGANAVIVATGTTNACEYCNSPLLPAIAHKKEAPLPVVAVIAPEEIDEELQFLLELDALEASLE